MATITETYLTLVEAARRADPSGNAAKIAEVLNLIVELWGILPIVQSNDVNSHVVHARLGLPDVTTRQVNNGAGYSVSKVKPKREAILLLEQWVRIDEVTLERQKNPNQTRHNEVIAMFEAMNQEWWERFFYDDPGDGADGILGLATRYDDPSEDNVFDAGGSGSDCTSMWMLEPGETKLGLVIPSGAKSGIELENKGKSEATGANGGPFEAYKTKCRLQMGLFNPDQMCALRLGSVESAGSDHTLFDESNNVHRNLIYMKNQLRSAGRGGYLVVNRTTKSQIDILAWDKGSNAFDVKTWDGQPVTHFQEMRALMCEALYDTEDAI